MGVSLDRFINVAITRATRTVSRRSFGAIMVIAFHTAWLDLSRTYSDPAEMLTDGFTADHPAYKAVARIFAQSPRVPSVKVGRRSGAPTQVIRLIPTQVAEGWVYSVDIDGNTVTHTVGAGDALADVCTDLATAIGAVATAESLDLSASGASGTHVDVTGDAPGDWFAFDNFDDRMTVMDETAEPATTLDTDLTAIRAADANWYGLIVADAQSAEQIEAVSTWAQSEKIVYCPHTMDVDVPSSSSADIVSDLKTAGDLRTAPFYNRNSHGRFPDAALFGAVFPLTVGSADFEFKDLEGIVADDLSTTELERLNGTPEDPKSGKRATVYVELTPTGTNSGTPATLGGLTSGGEWLDLIIGIDFTEALLQERAMNYRLNNPRPAFTAAGIDVFAGIVRAALRTVSRAPYNIFDESTISVTPTELEDVSDANRAARYYDGVAFDVRAQGSMRGVRFTGTVRP